MIQTADTYCPSFTFTAAQYNVKLLLFKRSGTVSQNTNTVQPKAQICPPPCSVDISEQQHAKLMTRIC